MAHAMFRSDNMAGTTQGKYLATIRVANTAIDNGMLVELGALATGERYIHTYTAPTASTPLGKLAIVGSEEVDKSKKFNSVGDFTNAVGTLARCYILEAGDYFSATAEAFDATPAVGKVIECKAGHQMGVVDTLTTNSTKIGECVAVEADGATTWYVVHVG